jgi:hypothetical protein
LQPDTPFTQALTGALVACVTALLAFALLLGGVAWAGRWPGPSEVPLLCIFLAQSALYFLVGQYLESRVLGN